MKRRVLTILLLLFAGAVLNVAVAWGFSLWFRPTIYFFDIEVSQSEIMWWQRNTPSHFGAPPDGARVRHSLGGDFLNLVYRGKWPDRAEYADRIRHGWPMLSLERSMWWVSPGQQRTKLGPIHKGRLQLPRFIDPWSRLLPYHVLPRGFMANTLVYAITLWLVTIGPFALRRFLRVRRGLCPKCAYPMRESAVCSECGAELPARRMATVATEVQ